MANRRDNDGIYLRKDGRYATSIMLGNHKRMYLYGKSKQEVREKRKKALIEREKGNIATGPKQTVKDYLNYWLEDVHRATLKLSTYTSYRRQVDKHILPALGHIPLRQLTTDQVQAFCSKKLKEGLATGTVSLLLTILDTALKDAVKWKRVAANVCDLVVPPKVISHEIQPLNKEQAQKLLETAKNSRLDCLLTLALATGMRLGEIQSLRWSDINLEGGLLQVRHTVNFFSGYGMVESDPKTASSRRSIALPRFVVDALIRQYAAQVEMRRKVGPKWQEQGLVFPNGLGKYLDRKTLYNNFKKLLQKAGLPDMRFHDLRHSAATILLIMGVHPKIVQEILGHSNISITLNTYSHVLPSMQRDAMDTMNTLFQGQQKQDGSILDLLKNRILGTTSYTEIANFPECVQSLHTLEELIGWLGSTNFQKPDSIEAALEELVRTANTLRPGAALKSISQRMRQQYVRDDFFRATIEQDVRLIEQYLDDNQFQDAFEVVSSLAKCIGKEVPQYRVTLAEWVVSHCNDKKA